MKEIDIIIHLKDQISKSLSEKEAREFNIDIDIIIHLKDQISRGLPEKEAKEFNLEFSKVFNVGADLSLVIPRFLIKLLNRSKLLCDKQGLEVTNKIIEMYENVLKGKVYSQEEWRKTGASALSDYTLGYSIGHQCAADAIRSAFNASIFGIRFAATAANDAFCAADTFHENLKQKTDLLEILKDIKPCIS